MKRTFDTVAALAGLVVLSPLLVLVAIAVRVLIGAPVLFRQKRPGKDEKIFTLFKFRTMRNSTDADGALLPDQDRLTGFGRFLRQTSLDELPELFNVLEGDMSLVGPRPLLPEYLPLYDLRQRRRHEVRPGITGWAQINGRNALTWQEKLELDVWYVENRSFLLDLRILAATSRIVGLARGINQPGHATAERFEGNQNQR